MRDLKRQQAKAILSRRVTIVLVTRRDAAILFLGQIFSIEQSYNWKNFADCDRIPRISGDDETDFPDSYRRISRPLAVGVVHVLFQTLSATVLSDCTVPCTVLQFLF